MEKMKKLNGLVVTLEFYEENGETCVYIAEEASSGGEYPVNSIEQVKEIIGDFLSDYI